MDEILDFEERLHAGRGVTLNGYFAALPDRLKTVETYIELAKINLYYSEWRRDDVAAAIRGLAHYAPDPTASQRRLLEGVYADQVAARRAPSIEAFAEWQDLVGPLDLRASDDCLPLGHIVDNRFQITRRLGSGRFGIVYLATDLASGAAVAAKSIRRGEDSEEDPLSRHLLHTEAAIALRLDHPRIPRAIAWLEKPEYPPMLVMQFVAGRSLRDRLRSSRMEWTEATCVIAQIARAAEHIHAIALVTHRDLTPDNIILDDHERAFLCDFGLAVSLADQFSREGEIAGKPNYQSPDVLLALGHEVDPRADVWALGSILYECLSGKPLGDGQLREEHLVNAVLASSLTLEFPESTPVSLKEICRRCLQPNPLFRFNSCRELADQLESVMGKASIPEHEIPVPVPLKNRSRDLIAFRAGLKLADVKRYIDLFDQLCPNGKPSLEERNQLGYALAALFGIAEAALDLSRYAAAADMPSCPSTDNARKFFYTASKLTQPQLEDVGRLVRAFDGWTGQAMDDLLRLFAPETVTVQACFELGFLAGLAKSPLAPEIMMERVAPLADIPPAIWQPYSEVIASRAGGKVMEAGYIRFVKSTERHLEYGEHRSVS